MSTEVIKNNANYILKNNDKYHFVATFGKTKGGFLSSSRSKTEAKNNAAEVLENKFNLDKLDKLRLFLLTIRKVTKQEKKDHKESEISEIGGPLVIIIEEYKVINNNGKLSFKNLKESLDNTNKVFFDKKYLKKYDYVDKKLITKLGFKYAVNTIGGGFTINTLTMYNKN
jgi:hypothetical protein